MTAADWLDDERPHDAETSAAQLRGLREHLAPAPRRGLDLGCGAGRTLVPLAAAGHRMVGLDRDPAALARCRAGLEAAGAEAELIEAELHDAWPVTGVFDAVLCLGNTLMTITDVDEAVTLFGRAAAVLGAGGVLVLDDGPADFWPELTEGNWLGGISETGDAQLVWHPSDAVFALRHGAAVDAACDELVPADRRFRLWTDGTLRLAARAAGLSAPRRFADARLLVLGRDAAGTGPFADAS